MTVKLPSSIAALPASIGAGFGLGVAGLVVIAGVAFVLYRSRGLLDPSSDQNLAYKAAGGVVTTISGGAAGGGEDTLGGAFARVREWMSGDDARIRDMLKGAEAYPVSAPADVEAEPIWGDRVAPVPYDPFRAAMP